MAICLFAATLCLAIRMLIYTGTQNNRDLSAGERWRSATKRPQNRLFFACLPFLIYALARFVTAEVFMDAERSFLLFLTPVLLGIYVFHGLTERQREYLHFLIIADLLLLGVYGIANHYFTGSEQVLWREGYADYFNEGRASGSYFCPDHYAGIMGLALCIGMSQLLSRNCGSGRKLMGGVLCAVALIGICLSKSRGAGITLGVVLIAALVWGFGQWQLEARIWNRVSATAALAIVMLIVFNTQSGYMTRFKKYFAWEEAQNSTPREMLATVTAKIKTKSRWRMISGALRAWKESRVIGIGPGMHQHLWPRHAAATDGDREEGVWPSSLDNYSHSYEVHSDWVQLLEEYGVVGLLLFLLPVGSVFWNLRRGLKAECLWWQRRQHRPRTNNRHPLILSGILALAWMGVHSLGDFNLQMPATTWLFAAMISLSLVSAFEAEHRQRTRRRA
jgi:O-antigen ligase